MGNQINLGVFVPHITMIQGEYCLDSFEDVPWAAQQDGEFPSFAIEFHKMAFVDPVSLQEVG